MNQYAFRMTGSDTISSTFSPRVKFGDTKFMIYFQHPSSSEYYLFQQAHKDTDVANMSGYRITLPTAMTTDGIALSYLDDMAGIVSLRTGYYAAMGLSLTTGTVSWQKEKAYYSTDKFCTSCSISSKKDIWAIGGKQEELFEIAILDKTASSNLATVRWDFHATSTAYNAYNWNILAVDATKISSTNYKMCALTRYDDRQLYTFNLLYFETSGSAVTDNITKVLKTLDYNNVVSAMAQIESDTAYFVVTTVKPETGILRLYKDTSGAKKFDLIRIYLGYNNNNSVITAGDPFTWTAAALLGDNRGFLFSGQLQRFKDKADQQTVTQGLSGVITGQEWVNSCVEYDTLSMTPESTESLHSQTFHDIIGSGELITSTQFSTLATNALSYNAGGSANFQGATFSNTGQYNQIDGLCTAPVAGAPTTSSQIYIIHTASAVSQDISWASFSLTTSYWSSYYAYGYSQTIAELGSDPSWATLVTGSQKTTIATTDDSLAGTYTLQVSGTLSPTTTIDATWYAASGGPYAAAAAYDLTLVEIVASTLADMEMSIGKGDKTQAIPGFTYNPSADVSSYTFQYSLEMQDGSAKPAWIYIDGSNNVMIDDAQNPVVGTWNMRLKGEAVDATGTALGRFKTVDFAAKVYTLVASTVADQYVSVGQASSHAYTVPAFSASNYAPTSYTLSYQLLDSPTGSDVTSSTSWLSFSFPTLTVANSVAASDTGEYTYYIVGTLDDTAAYPGNPTTANVQIKVFIISFASTAVSSDPVHLIGSSTVTSQAITPFTYTPSTAGSLTITYAVSIDAGTPTVSSFAVSGNANIVVGPETSDALFGTHAVTLTGTLSDSAASTATAGFQIHLVKVEGTLSSVYYRIETAGTAQSSTFGGVTFTPSASPVPSYTFTYALVGWDGSSESVADAAVFSFNTGTSAFDVATSDATKAADYPLAIKVSCDQDAGFTKYIAFTAYLYTYTPQTNNNVYYEPDGTTQTVTINTPTVTGSMTKTVELYAPDQTTLAKDAYSWLTFDPTSDTMTIQSSDPNDAGVYDLQLKTTLSDGTVQWQTLTVYIIVVTPVAQNTITYILGQIVITQAISDFTYQPPASQLPSTPSWAYSASISSGDQYVSTVSSATGSDLLVGTTTGAGAGVTTGVITNAALDGTHTYSLQGVLSFTDANGQTFSSTPQSINYDVEIINISITASASDIVYRSGTTAIVQNIPVFTQSRTGAAIPTYTYTYSLHLYDGSTFSAVSAAQLTFDASTPALTVYTVDVNFGAIYDLAVRATVNEVPSATAFDAFKVTIYSLQAASISNIEHLIGPNSMTFNFPSFDTSGFAGSITYQLQLTNGSSASGVYSWLTVTDATPSVTISSNAASDQGTYTFRLQGVFAVDGTVVYSSFSILLVTPVVIPVDPIYYMVTERARTLQTAPFYTSPTTANFSTKDYTMASVDTTTNLVSTASLPTAISLDAINFKISVETSNTTLAGFYRVRLTGTAYDKTGACSNTATLSTDIDIIIMAITPTALPDFIKTITIVSPFYTFPPFVQLPAANTTLGIPDVAIDYSLALVSTDNSWTPDIEDFAKLYDNEAIRFYTDQFPIEANYTVALVGTFTVNQVTYEYSTEFNVTWLAPARTYVEPVGEFTPLDIPDQTVPLSEGWDLPTDEVTGIYGDKMEKRVILGEAEDFMTYDEETGKFDIEDGALRPEHVGTYPIQIVYHYQNETYTEQHTETFFVTIDDDRIPDFIDNKENRVRIESIREWLKLETSLGLLEGGLELGAEDDRQPIPSIRDLTTTGLVVIEWDRPMLIPDDIDSINKMRVALGMGEKKNETYLTPAPWQTRRQLAKARKFSYLENLDLDNEWFLMMDALELHIRPGDDRQDPAFLTFSWEIVDFTERQIYIQMMFEYHWHISEWNLYDSLEIYFWGRQLFQSKDGLAVRQGSQIERKILRQIPPITADRLWTFGTYVSWFIWTICLYNVLVSGRLLSTWMFLNSLQLVAHLVLFDSQMPGMAAYYLCHLLYVAKFNPFPGWHFMNQQFGHLAEGGHNVRFHGFSYESIYLLANLNLITAFGVILLAFWLLILLRDLFVRVLGERLSLKDRLWHERYEKGVHNFAMRYLYEVFLELFICILISLALRRPYTGDNFSTEEQLLERLEGAGDPMNKRDHALAITITILLTVFFLWATSFAWRQAASCLPCSKVKTKYKPTTSLWLELAKEFLPFCSSCPRRLRHFFTCKCKKEKLLSKQRDEYKRQVFWEEIKLRRGLKYGDDDSDSSFIYGEPEVVIIHDEKLEGSAKGQKKRESSDDDDSDFIKQMMMKSAFKTSVREQQEQESLDEEEGLSVSEFASDRADERTNMVVVTAKTRQQVQFAESDHVDSFTRDMDNSRSMLKPRRNSTIHYRLGVEEPEERLMSSHSSFLSNDEKQVNVYPVDDYPSMDAHDDSHKPSPPMKRMITQLTKKNIADTIVRTSFKPAAQKKKQQVHVVQEEMVFLDPDEDDEGELTARSGQQAASLSTFKNGVSSGTGLSQGSRLSPANRTKQVHVRTSLQKAVENQRAASGKNEGGQSETQQEQDDSMPTSRNQSARSYNVDPDVRTDHQIESTTQVETVIRKSKAARNEQEGNLVIPAAADGENKKTVIIKTIVTTVMPDGSTKEEVVEERRVVDKHDEVVQPPVQQPVAPQRAASPRQQVRETTQVMESPRHAQVKKTVVSSPRNQKVTVTETVVTTEAPAPTGSQLLTVNNATVQVAREQLSSQSSRRSALKNKKQSPDGTVDHISKENQETDRDERVEVAPEELSARPSPSKRGRRKKKKVVRVVETRTVEVDGEAALDGQPNANQAENEKVEATAGAGFSFNQPAQPSTETFNMTTRTAAQPWNPQRTKTRKLSVSSEESARKQGALGPIEEQKEILESVNLGATRANFRAKADDIQDLQNKINISDDGLSDDGGMFEGGEREELQGLYSGHASDDEEVYEYYEEVVDEPGALAPIDEVDDEDEHWYESSQVLAAKTSALAPAGDYAGNIESLKLIDSEDERERQDRAFRHVQKESDLREEVEYWYPRSRTLFYGIRFDWRVQVFTFHIALFLLRRIVLALFLVFGDWFAYEGILVMVLTAYLMLYILIEHSQWSHSVIRRQHVVNETVFLLLCYMLLIFQGAYPQLEEQLVTIIGYIFLTVLTAYIIYNLCNIVYHDIYLHCRLHWLRRQAIIKYRQENRLKRRDLNKRNLYAWKKLQAMRKEEVTRITTMRKEEREKLKVLRKEEKTKLMVERRERKEREEQERKEAEAKRKAEVRSRVVVKSIRKGKDKPKPTVVETPKEMTQTTEVKKKFLNVPKQEQPIVSPSSAAASTSTTKTITTVIGRKNPEMSPKPKTSFITRMRKPQAKPKLPQPPQTATPEPDVEQKLPQSKTTRTVVTKVVEPAAEEKEPVSFSQAIGVKPAKTVVRRVVKRGPTAHPNTVQQPLQQTSVQTNVQTKTIMTEVSEATEGSAKRSDLLSPRQAGKTRKVIKRQIINKDGKKVEVPSGQASPRQHKVETTTTRQVREVPSSPRSTGQTKTVTRTYYVTEDGREVEAPASPRQGSQTKTITKRYIITKDGQRVEAPAEQSQTQVVTRTIKAGGQPASPRHGSQRKTIIKTFYVTEDGQEYESPPTPRRGIRYRIIYRTYYIMDDGQLVEASSPREGEIVTTGKQVVQEAAGPPQPKVSALDLSKVEEGDAPPPTTQDSGVPKPRKKMLIRGLTRKDDDSLNSSKMLKQVSSALHGKVSEISDGPIQKIPIPRQPVDITGGAGSEGSTVVVESTSKKVVILDGQDSQAQLAREISKMTGQAPADIQAATQEALNATAKGSKQLQSQGSFDSEAGASSLSFNNVGFDYSRYRQAAERQSSNGVIPEVNEDESHYGDEEKGTAGQPGLAPMKTFGIKKLTSDIESILKGDAQGQAQSTTQANYWESTQLKTDPVGGNMRKFESTPVQAQPKEKLFGKISAQMGLGQGNSRSGVMRKDTIQRMLDEVDTVISAKDKKFAHNDDLHDEEMSSSRRIVLGARQSENNVVTAANARLGQKQEPASSLIMPIGQEEESKQARGKTSDRRKSFQSKLQSSPDVLEKVAEAQNKKETNTTFMSFIQRPTLIFKK